MKKANSKSQGGADADSGKKVEDTPVNQHSRKPDVVGSPSVSDEKGLAVHMICHPERPYEEYVLVSPEEYVEGLTYSDYKKIYKPIVVAELETTVAVGEV